MESLRFKLWLKNPDINSLLFLMVQIQLKDEKHWVHLHSRMIFSLADKTWYWEL